MRTVESAFEELKKAGVPDYLYSYGYYDYAVCIERDGSAWQVYSAERGQKCCLRVFNSESEACDHFVDEVLLLKADYD